MAFLITAATIGAAATIYSGMEAANAQEEAQGDYMAQLAYDRALRKEMFYESRGKGGFAVMPYYARDANGNPLEQTMLQDTRRLYDATAMSPAARLARYGQASAEMAPAQLGAQNTVADIYNGGIEAQQMSAAAPVMAARTAAVGARKNANIEAMQAQLNQIRATQAGKGFVGDSSTTQRLEFDARRNAYTQNALDKSQANLMNAEDVRGIRNAAQNLRLSNVSLPYQMTRQKIDLANLPEDLAMDNAARRQQLFNFFRIGVGAPAPYESLPYQPPVPSTGQIVGQGVAAGASAMGDYFANQRLAQLYNGGGTMSPATQIDQARRATYGGGNLLGTPAQRNQLIVGRPGGGVP